MLRGQALAKRVMWELRASAGAKPASLQETYRHLLAKQRRSARGESGTAQMPWGMVEYASIDVIAPQFNELFLQRQYAFKPRSASPTIVDCGGNIGLSAIWFKQSFPGARLTVYEADPALAAILRRNLTAAGIHDVAVHDAAVWTASGKVRFDARGDDTGRIAADGAVEVDAIDLATELPPRVDLLKMDIEGAEFAVLERLCATGALDRVDNLVAELHIGRDRTDAALTLLRTIRDAGMEISFTAGVGPWLGLASHTSSFEIVARNNVFMILYAWRQ